MLPSYHDLTNENSYHMMMLGMCICLSGQYKVISNREEGKVIYIGLAHHGKDVIMKWTER